MHILQTPKLTQKAYACNHRTIHFYRPLVMAIVNLTPDSFYDGGKYSATEDILRDVAAKVNAGADIIDIGAASSRPGAELLTAEAEWQRMETALIAVRTHHPNVLISVDTVHASVAEKAAKLGVDIINDISGGLLDSNMLGTVARLNLPYVMMHMNGTPKTMATLPEMAHAHSEVYTFFKKQCDQLTGLGFSKIILDPGFGFGKSLANNYELLGNLSEYRALGFPLLVGVSRKSMISKITSGTPVTALNGTSVIHTIALLNGANILRVHDVKEAIEAIKLVSFYLQCQEVSTS
jgi:dihydropteroate synthase